MHPQNTLEGQISSPPPEMAAEVYKNSEIKEKFPEKNRKMYYDPRIENPKAPLQYIKFNSFHP